MRSRRRTEITVETERMVLIRQRRGVARVWCASCAEQVKMIPADVAAAVAGVSTRTIYRWVEAEKVHFTETSDGLLLICLNSLTAVMSDK